MGWNESLKEKIKVGNHLRIFFNEGNRNNELINIRDIVDNDYIVYRTYDIGREEFRYHLEHIYYFYLLDKDGVLKEADTHD